MDETLKDEDLALMLLRSLPEEFEFLETTLLYRKVNVSLSEALRDFLNWKKMMETQTGKRINHFRIENGGKYRSDPFA